MTLRSSRRALLVSTLVTALIGLLRHELFPVAAGMAQALGAVLPDPEPPRRVALYVRISTDERQQKWSLDAQIDRLLAFAHARGWVVVFTYRETASAKSLDRPELQKALRDAEQGRFDVLLFVRIDRLSRRLLDLLDVVETFRKHHVEAVSATEPFDTGTAIGRAVMHILGALAELEREMITDRIREGMRKGMEAGRFFGSVPIGMMKDENGVPCADPDWIDLVKKIFHMYVDQMMGCTTIARTLNEQGYVTRRGSPFQGPKISEILQSPTYIGKRRSKDGSLTDAGFEPVIDPRLWHKAERLRAERNQNLALRRSNESSHVLSGVSRCGKCGRPYIGISGYGRGGRNYGYYCCQGKQKYGKSHCSNGNLPQRQYEEAVLSSLLDVLGQSDLLEEAWEVARKQVPTNTRRLKRERAQLDKQLALVDTKLRRYYDAFEGGTLNAESLQARVDELTEQRAALVRQRLLVDVDLEREAADFPADELARMTGLLARAPDGEDGRESTPQVKALLRILIKDVEIFAPDDIRPTFRLPVTADGQPIDASEKHARPVQRTGARKREGAVRATTAQVVSEAREPLWRGHPDDGLTGRRGGCVPLR